MQWLCKWPCLKWFPIQTRTRIRPMPLPNTFRCQSHSAMAPMRLYFQSVNVWKKHLNFWSAFFKPWLALHSRPLSTDTIWRHNSCQSTVNQEDCQLPLSTNLDTPSLFWLHFSQFILIGDLKILFIKAIDWFDGSRRCN